MLEMKRKKKTLNDVVPDWLTGDGVMGTLTKNYTVPWKADYAGEEMLLDISYQGGHSGTKWTAPLLDNFIDETTEKISNADLVKITGAVWATYKRKWEKLWMLYTEEYDPLHNYDMTEEETEGIQSTGKKTGTVEVSGNQTLDTADTTTKTGTVQNNDTDTFNKTDTTTKNLTTTVNDETTYGKVDTKQNTGTVQDSKTDTYDRTDTTTKNLQTDVTDETTYGKIDTKQNTGIVQSTGTDTFNNNINAETYHEIFKDYIAEKSNKLEVIEKKGLFSFWKKR